jgi:hypothetical protein
MEPSAALARIRPLLVRMASTLWPVIRKSVTPIAVIQGERTIPWGTGTCFRVADESFLVTACHVWDMAEKNGFDHDLYVFDLDGDFDGQAKVRPVPLTGRLYRVRDPHDVAVLELDSSTVSEFRTRTFLRLSEVALRPRWRHSCWVLGFPLEAAVSVAAQSLFRFNQLFLLAPFCQRDVALDNYDPAWHFLLDATRDSRWQLDGTPGEMPRRLNGISGCSLWETEWPPDNAPDSWKPESTRIVGVQTSYYEKSSIIKATHWGAVADVLYQVRPDLRPSIEVHLGLAS